jgi:hypothetical protein
MPNSSLITFTIVRAGELTAAYTGELARLPLDR